MVYLEEESSSPPLHPLNAATLLLELDKQRFGGIELFGDSKACLCHHTCTVPSWLLYGSGPQDAPPAVQCWCERWASEFESTGLFGSKGGQLIASN